MKYYYLSKLRRSSDSAYSSLRESLGVHPSRFPGRQGWDALYHRALIVEGGEPKDLIEYEVL